MDTFEETVKPHKPRLLYKTKLPENLTVPNCQSLPPVIGIESFAATADSTFGNSSKDLFGLIEKRQL